MDVSTQIPVERNSSHNQRFAEMFAAAAIGIAICDLDGRIQEANPTLARMLGYGPIRWRASISGTFLSRTSRLT